MPKVPQTRILQIFVMFLENMGDEVDFLPADKRKSLLQVDSTVFGVCSQLSPKYLK